MKRFGLFLIILVLFTGSIFAQNTEGFRFNERQQENNLVTVNGTLILERGLVAVQSERENPRNGERALVFLVPSLNRYIGFINGLSEGKAVSIEGYRFRNVIQPVKLTIDGRTYNLAAPGSGTSFGNYGNNPHMNNNPWQNRNFDNNNNQRNRQNRCCCCN